MNIFEKLFPSLTWIIPSKNTLYLTFDDGPVPRVTPWVLETLEKYHALATFFCVGDNVRKHPDIFKSVSDAGHSIGNHTMHHSNGWKINNQLYFQDIHECDAYVHSHLFRPPYGKLKPSQIRFLKTKFKIIMWDVLSKDYDNSLTGDNCFNIIKKKSREGSIIVFHDSLKSEKNLRIALPATLKYFSDAGFTFSAIQS